jgi:hypothetical protein
MSVAAEISVRRCFYKTNEYHRKETLAGTYSGCQIIKHSKENAARKPSEHPWPRNDYKTNVLLRQE